MKSFFRKFSLLALFSVFTMFLFSCYGSTSIHVKDNHRRGTKHYPKRYPRYDVRYESHHRVPPGHYKKHKKHKPTKHPRVKHRSPKHRR